MRKGGKAPHKSDKMRRAPDKSNKMDKMAGPGTPGSSGSLCQGLHTPEPPDRPVECYGRGTYCKFLSQVSHSLESLSHYYTLLSWKGGKAWHSWKMDK
jgi:hypothetical protein